MSLPVINVPTYKLDIPSTKESIKFRPFRVNEEKILLLALETSEENPSAMMDAVRQIIENCTFGEIELKGLALFDLEYIFLRIRAKSVGEIAKVKLLAEDDGETYVEVDIPLEEIEVHFDKTHKNDIKLSDDIGVIMKYPQYEDLEGTTTQDAGVEVAFKMIKNCVSSVYEGKTVHERVDFTDDDLDTFINSLASEQFLQLQNFFITMPKLKHEVKFKNPKTKKMNTVTLEGLASFFG